MITQDEFPVLPFGRSSVLEIPPQLRTLLAGPPITRVRTAVGDVAWLVTGYAEVKTLFGDRRLGRSHPDPANAPRISESPLFGGPVSNYDTELAEHARMRALLVPLFSARRMAALQPRVEALVDDLLAALAERDSPADLHEALSFPLPVLVICELLGVPYADRDRFRAWSDDMCGLYDLARAAAAFQNLIDYMRGLIERKRAHPDDGVISALCVAEDGGLDDGYIGWLTALLLFAGHETTVARIDMGSLLLLVNPDQRERLRSDPAVLSTAVEEILRLGNSGGGPGLPRYAREDIDIAGVRIRAGEAVLLDVVAANNDGAAFAEPERFDVTRTPNPHMTFGHGLRFCIGASLARIELAAVFSRLPRRFPGLRLAVPVEALRVREDLLTGGLAELPVTW